MSAPLQLLASFAVSAVLEEALLFPKPGLVDPISAGAHRDMDITTFIRSASVLPFGFATFAEIGYAAAGCTDARRIRKKLREAGILLEQQMFEATGGVNTHKGTIFLFAYLLGAAGMLLARKDTHTAEKHTVDTLFATVRFLAEGIVQEDMQNILEKENATHGEEVYRRYGAKGIRGEVEAGLPLVAEGLAYLHGLTHISRTDAQLYTLLYLIQNGEDTNVLFRAGRDRLTALQEECRLLLARRLEGPKLYAALAAFDTYCVNKNISPGGAADMLAAVLFCSRCVTEGIFSGTAKKL